VRTCVSPTLTAGADAETLTTAHAAGTAAINPTGNGGGNAIIAGVSAQDGNDCIIHKSVTGALLYDGEESGGAARSSSHK
jgi:hypothetical protein